MASALKKTVRLKEDKTTGRTKVVKAAPRNPSTARKIAKSKTKRVVSPKKARAAR